MKKRFALLLLLILPLMAGCLTDSDDDDDGDSGSGSGVSASDYMPLKTGSTYVYRDTSTDSYTEEPDIEDYVMTVDSTVSINGKTYTMVADAYEGWTDTTYARIADNTVYIYGLFYKQTAKAGVTVSKPADYNLLAEMPMYNFGADTWTIYEDSGSNEYGSHDTSWTGRYVGRQSVTVPAGTFANCIVLELTLEEDGTFLDNDDPYLSSSWTSEETVTMWFAKSIGLVKSHAVYTYVYTFEDNTKYEEDDTTTTELTSCSIP